ncbi:putative 2OG-Fe(II) oxygenase [Qipengyuania soli]|uniref:Tetratricopeptide repeat protein n=1 Tax=Qipengyuania soli TaxID=2782568 RepID=A0A7S8IUR7_9SPHN|nr:putative 2OG-Fe(II) oxygenase [Qipengyuania soli]QPC99334.1 tetratricopeptide repeat protein [Qipengyuania soli]
MNRTEARQRIADFPLGDFQAAFARGVELVRSDHAEILLPVARNLADTFPREARAHQLLGLASRTAQESATAVSAFSKAAQIAPGDALIAHSHARAVLEAGLPASALFERAIALAPQDGTARLGLAAAFLHEGRAQDAVALLDALLSANPEWIDGHRDAAHLRGQLGIDPYATIAAAIRSRPRSAVLHGLHVSIRLEALDLEGAARALDDAQRLDVASAELQGLAAHTASELGRIAEADSLFAAFDPSRSVGDASLFARHLLRAGRPELVSPLLDPILPRDFDHLLWPYQSLAWRLTGDPRYDWLEGDSSLVGVYDIADAIGDMAGLAEHLRGLHFAKAQPLDQSVRGGTQTDGNLLLRTDPVIQHLRRVILETVARHVAQLPAPREGHPTFLAERDPLRVAGSWSVRLRDAGFHSDHVHGRGWISSALYIHLPETMADTTQPDRSSHAGWLSIGECRDILPDLDPVRLIEPAIGRLVLFPSTMWHGTRAFPSGERMTVAFDIARPTP